MACVHLLSPEGSLTISFRCVHSTKTMANMTDTAIMCTTIDDGEYIEKLGRHLLRAPLRPLWTTEFELSLRFFDFIAGQTGLVAQWWVHCLQLRWTLQPIKDRNWPHTKNSSCVYIKRARKTTGTLRGRIFFRVFPYSLQPKRPLSWTHLCCFICT